MQNDPVGRVNAMKSFIILTSILIPTIYAEKKCGKHLDIIFLTCRLPSLNARYPGPECGAYHQ